MTKERKRNKKKQIKERGERMKMNHDKMKKRC